jgi:hypothetical protein
MNAGAVKYNSQPIDEKAFALNYKRKLSREIKRFGQFFEDLTQKAREDFLSFFNQQGLDSEAGLLVIPASHHFYYDADDLKEIKTVINLKQLNHVRDIKEFLRNIASLMPYKSNFVGCFVDNRAQNSFSDKSSNLPSWYTGTDEAFENGIASRIPFINRMYSFFDARTNRYLSRQSVINLLEEHGFQIIRMTELHGLTYFYTQKIKPAA